MSVVTSVVILGSIAEDEPHIHAAMESFFAKERSDSHDKAHREAAPMYVSAQKVGGWSALQGTLFAGAWNHLDYLSFLTHLRDTVPWAEPENVRVFIKREDDDGWSEVLLWPNKYDMTVLTIESDELRVRLARPRDA